MKVNNKIIWMIGGIGGFLAILFMLVCWLDDRRLETVEVPEQSTIQLIVEPGTVRVKSQVLLFEQWFAFVPNERINTFDIRVVLQNVTTGESFTIPTEMSQSSDIYKKYDEEDLRLEFSGFNANIPLKELDLENSSYRIILYYNSNDDDAYFYTGYGITAGGNLYEE